jgi:hypothetical protein
VLLVNILWRQKMPLLLLITVPRTGLSVGPDVGATDHYREGSRQLSLLCALVSI